jgi:hypothetical protein
MRFITRGKNKDLKGSRRELVEVIELVNLIIMCLIRRILIVMP